MINQRRVFRETDPEVLLPVNPLAALTTAFSELEQSILAYAKQFGFPHALESEGLTALQFLEKTNRLPPERLRYLELLKALRDQASHLPTEVDVESARKFLKMAKGESNWLRERTMSLNTYFLPYSEEYPSRLEWIEKLQTSQNGYVVYTDQGKVAGFVFNDPGQPIDIGVRLGLQRNELQDFLSNCEEVHPGKSFGLPRSQEAFIRQVWAVANMPSVSSYRRYGDAAVRSTPITDQEWAYLGSRLHSVY